jgi:hypothetical protein
MLVLLQCERIGEDPKPTTATNNTSGSFHLIGLSLSVFVSEPALYAKTHSISKVILFKVLSSSRVLCLGVEKWVFVVVDELVALAHRVNENPIFSYHYSL